MPHFINDACTVCHLCIEECPTKSIYKGRTQYYIDFDSCTDCKICVAICPDAAIFPKEDHNPPEKLADAEDNKQTDNDEKDPIDDDFEIT